MPGSTRSSAKGSGCGCGSTSTTRSPATVAALDHGFPGIYNLADDGTQTLAEWLPAYAEWVGGPPPPREELPAGADPNDYFYPLLMRGISSAKAKAELGFSPSPRPWA